MGFLDHFIRKKAKEFAADAMGDMSGQTILNGKPVSNTTEKRKKSGKESPKEQERGLRQRLENVIMEEWSGYELRMEVSPSEVDAAEKARKLSYALYQGGQLKAVMMVLTDRNHYRRSDVVKVADACRSRNIPYMNFMSYLPNRREYISERLKKEIAG